jgi:hypothetical protein
MSPESLITLYFQRALSASPATPTISPAVPGRWSQTGVNSLTFTPTSGFQPGSQVTVSVDDQSLTYSVASESMTLAQGLLARLGYLPFTVVVPIGQPGAPAAPAYYLRWQGSPPPALAALWQPGSETLLTKAAVEGFEAAEGLKSGSWPAYAGTTGGRFWNALLAAAAHGTMAPSPFAFVTVNQGTSPETLSIWMDGRTVFTSPANTGIPVGSARTPDGVFPIYYRLREQTMHGTTYTGQPYVYPNVPDINYFDGDLAIHGFVRQKYGFPQSQGCVELPLQAAATAYKLLNYGDLVNITGSATLPASSTG